ncbi:hypothetical protein E2L08_09590 [Palleronia sediminis]|uniref:Uncharacterized protein n=1 Tax=Palleronia sediminis TaxID=2547833 RepID=A0A4R6AED0_9RHOB|nr:hypothetical protein E2L08_09590 [Palleronia sediminis]
MAEEQVVEILGDLEGAKLRLRAEDALVESELRGLSEALRRAVQTMFTERERLDALRRKQAGIAHDYAMDFEAARAEIGRRLARLRAAGHG